jgi:hypothetical protein
MELGSEFKSFEICFLPLFLIRKDTVFLPDHEKRKKIRVLGYFGSELCN